MFGFHISISFLHFQRMTIATANHAKTTGPVKICRNPTAVDVLQDLQEKTAKVRIFQVLYVNDNIIYSFTVYYVLYSHQNFSYKMKSFVSKFHDYYFSSLDKITISTFN